MPNPQQIDRPDAAIQPPRPRAYQGLFAFATLCLAAITALLIMTEREPEPTQAPPQPIAEAVPAPAPPPAPAPSRVAEPAPPPAPAPVPVPEPQRPIAEPMPAPVPSPAPAPPQRAEPVKPPPKPPVQEASRPPEAKPPPPPEPKQAEIAWPHLFGTVEARSSNLRPFTKWTWMLDRYAQERSLEIAPCAQLGALKCRPKVWREFLATLEGKPRSQQIEEVNAYMNRHAYIEDLPNYGVPDYWATPMQFLTKDGDCEDYAIAKYMSLRILGFKEDEVRLVVLQDMNLNAAHAVLVVHHEGKALLLDNQLKRVVDAGIVRHYRPYFSINENSWWLHKSLAPGPTVGGAVSAGPKE